jgi:Ricin-type beta-trefoil lectin domain-like
MKLLKVTAAGLLVAVLALAEIGFRGPGLYEIMNKKSARMMALDPDRSSVIQIASRSKEDQRWIVEPAPGGAFFIRSAVNGYALQITNNAKSAPVICARFDGSPSQQWRMEPASDGNPFIVSVAGGRALDIPNGSNKEGLRIQIYDRDGDSNQQFVFNFIQEPPDRDRARRAGWDRR